MTRGYYRPSREVELRDLAVKALREACDYIDERKHDQALCHVHHEGRKIVDEIDQLHALALLGAAGKVA